MLSEVKVELTIQLPDDENNQQKIVALLRKTSEQVSNIALEIIGDLDSENLVLGHALSYEQQPQHYRERITQNYQNAMAWNAARMQVERIIWSAIMQIKESQHTPTQEASDVDTARD